MILIFVGIYIWIWILNFQSNPLVNPTEIDHFLSYSLCGRLISIPNLTLTSKEYDQLNSEASNYLIYPQDCTFFQQFTADVSSNDSIAFTILIHPNIDQFDYLLRLIYQRHHVFCIHIDLKASDELYASIQSRSKCVENIIFPNKRLNVTWGKFSVIEAEHLCQKKLLEYSQQWKYYFNLGSSDIPLKTSRELNEILKFYNQQNDITSLVYRSQLRQQNTFINKTLPSSIKQPVYKGEFHVLLTRTAVEFIHTNRRVRDLYEYLNGTFVPDEHYYAIINRWKETPGYYPYDHDLSQKTFMTRYKIWIDRPEARLCRGGFVRGICIFNYQDLWHLTTSPHFFANKILFERDRIAPYCLAKYLDIRQRNDFLMIDHDFYRQLDNVRFGRTREYS